MRLLVRGAIVSLVLQTTAAAAADDVTTYRRQAAVAYKAKDWTAFLENAAKASALRPDHPGLLYNVACARSLTGDAKGALQALETLAAWKVDLGAETDPDLEAARRSPDFGPLKERLAALRKPIGTASVAFELPDRDLAEGIAYDPVSKTFLVGSVHGRRIVRRSAAGAVTPFATHDLGVFGMAVDAERRLLWAATAALPEMSGYDKSMEGKTALVAFDLATGKEARRVAPPAGGGAHSFNDVTVSPKGEVYLSDSVGGQVYRLAPTATALETVVPAGVLRSPNGLALSPDGKRLYVSDWATTVHAVELETSKVTALAAPAGSTTIGIDGLVWHRGALVAVQNGVTPHRVVRLSLGKGGDALERAEVLLMNDPRFDEPTLGVVVGNDLHLVADSHWGKFDAKTGVFPAATVSPTVILRLGL